MINALDGVSASAEGGSAVRSDMSRSTAAQRSTTLASLPDSIDISDAARSLCADMDANVEIFRSNEREEAANPGSRWRLATGFKEGTFTLENGNTQTVKINGDSLEIMEYRNGDLVKSVAGALSDGGASLDTIYYDDNGEISQTIHTDIEEMQGRKGWSLARMRRSVQWFDNGKLTGDMQDSMLLNTRNSTDAIEDGGVDKRVRDLLDQATEKAADSVEAFKSDLTRERHVARYYAELVEYGATGRRSSEMTVEYEGRYEQLSNRSEDDFGDMDARSTEELSHDTGLTINIKNYDDDGELVRDASFSDEQQDAASGETDGRQRQQLDVSWFSGGELVKHSHGSMTVEETASAKLPDRPGVLDILGLSAEQYLGDEPQSAADLLSAGAVTSAQEPDAFLSGVERRAANGEYASAEHLGAAMGADRPYAVDWTDEIYRDGELAHRRRDSETARETSFSQRERARMFRVGRGLTENDSPVVLQRSLHEREVYEDGKVTGSVRTEARESVEIGDSRPDRLVTRASLTRGPEDDATTTLMKFDGGLEQVDPEPHAASRGMGGETRVTLDDFRANVRSMNERNLTGWEAGLVRLDYRSRFEE